MKKFVYINNLYHIYFYLETNYIYILSNNNSRKKKKKLPSIYLYISNMLIKKYNVFKIDKKNVNTIIENKEINFFKGSFYSYKSKIKIVGRGWKIIKTNYNTLLIKLGYSHPLFLILGTSIKYKIKKKKKNIMFFMVFILIKYIH